MGIGRTVSIRSICSLLIAACACGVAETGACRASGAAPSEGPAGASRAAYAKRSLRYDVATATAAERVDAPPAVDETTGEVLDTIVDGVPNSPFLAAPHLAPEMADASEEPAHEKRFGEENRQQVTNTLLYPWRTVCKLEITFPKSKLPGTGVILDSTHVLTAGHCVYNKKYGGWATSIRVIPALNGAKQPFGSAWATTMRTFWEWAEQQNPNYDMGLVTIGEPLGDVTGWMGHGVMSDLDGATAHVSGYPTDLPSKTSPLRGKLQYRDSGPLAFFEEDPDSLYYQMDTGIGQSGGPVIRVFDGKHYVVGVHAGEVASQDLNSATRFTSEKFSRIHAWIDEEE